MLNYKNIYSSIYSKKDFKNSLSNVLVSEKYEQAVSYYLEVIIAIQRGSELELTEAEMNNVKNVL